MGSSRHSTVPLFNLMSNHGNSVDECGRSEFCLRSRDVKINASPFSNCLQLPTVFSEITASALPDHFKPHRET